MLHDKTILVTGGTGSFGRAFVKRVLADQGPKKVIVLSRDELKQYEMAQEIPDERLRFFLGDVRDRDRLYRAFDGVDVVIHAAALKQVPAAQYNPSEFVKTNVYGSENVFSAAIDRGVGRVVLLSTDKRVSPANVYGATKMLAEELCLSYNRYSGDKQTKLSAVRYGNVVGSRGSVVPLFASMRGGEVPVTDVRMTRFFLSLDHAVQLVLDALHFMRGGEVYVPKIPSMRVVDLAEAFGCTYRVVGIRPGEKVHETLISEDEAPNTTEYQDFYVIQQGQNNVAPGFSYTSDTNPVWLSVEDLGLLCNTLTNSYI